MKLLAALAVLLVLQAQPAQAQTLEAVAGEALIDRFIAVLPDREAFGAGAQVIDPAELARLVALNPGKEAQVRSVLKSNLACTGPAIEAVSLRMLRTVARNLGDSSLRKLIGFYRGPDYAGFAALAARIGDKPNPGAEDKAAMAKYMGAYPLQAFYEQLSRAEEIIAADPSFMSAAMKCASEQIGALEAAGLKAN